MSAAEDYITATLSDRLERERPIRAALTKEPEGIASSRAEAWIERRWQAYVRAKLLTSGSDGPTLASVSPAQADEEALQSPIIEARDKKISVAHEAIEKIAPLRQGSNAIEQRLMALVDAAGEEYPDTDVPKAATIFAFAQLASKVLPGSITLSPSGHIWVHWANHERDLVLEFLPNGLVNFAAVSPDPANALRKARHYGQQTVSAMLEQIVNDPLMQWVAQA